MTYCGGWPKGDHPARGRLHFDYKLQAGTCIVAIARAATYYLEDGSAAAQNVLLAATALGLQSCWIAGDKKTYAGEILRRYIFLNYAKTVFYPCIASPHAYVGRASLSQPCSFPRRTS